MKKNKRIIIISLVVLALVFIMAKCAIGPKKYAGGGDMSAALEQKILSFELANYGEDGNKKWKLKGESADILSEVVNLSSINMETYDQPKINLTASMGTYDKDNKEISLFKDVKVLTSDGATLTTEYLKWDGQNDTITTNEHVRVVRSDVVADGVGALAMPELKRIILDKEIRVKLQTEVGGPIEMSFEEDAPNLEKRPADVIITCDGPLEIDYEKNIAIFRNNVLVDDERGKIYSEKMTAHLDMETKNISRVVAEGGVKVVREGDSTFSDKAIYTTIDRKIVLIGKPRIEFHANEDMNKMEKELEGL